MAIKTVMDMVMMEISKWIVTMKTFNFNNGLEDYLQFFLVIWIILLIIGYVASGGQCLSVEYTIYSYNSWLDSSNHNYSSNSHILRQLETQIFIHKATLFFGIFYFISLSYKDKNPETSMVLFYVFIALLLLSLQMFIRCYI